MVASDRLNESPTVLSQAAGPAQSEGRTACLEPFPRFQAKKRAMNETIIKIFCAHIEPLAPIEVFGLSVTLKAKTPG
jgi:hypothetical protein